MSSSFRAALLLSEAFRDAGISLRAVPRFHPELEPTVPATADDGEHYAEMTPTEVILLHVVGKPHSLGLYDSLLHQIGAKRVNVEPDGRVTVFTYRISEP